MEQRFCSRLPLALPVILSTADKTLSCTTRDFGMGGMFLELDHNLPNQGERANITFTLEKNGLKTKHRISVIVRRTSDDGLGISFAQPNVVTYRSVQELLKCGQQQTVH